MSEKNLTLKYVSIPLENTVLNPSVRIGISLYSTTRMIFTLRSAMKLNCLAALQEIPENVVVNSIYLRFGSTVIRVQRPQTSVCPRIFLDTLLSILVSLRFFHNFGKKRFTQRSWVSENLNNLHRLYSKMDVTKSCCKILSQIDTELSILFPSPVRCTINFQLDSQAQVYSIIRTLFPSWLRVRSTFICLRFNTPMG